MDEINWDLKTVRDCFKIFVNALTKYGIIIQGQGPDIVLPANEYIDNLEIDRIKYLCNYLYAEYLASRGSLPVHEYNSVKVMYLHTMDNKRLYTIL